MTQWHLSNEITGKGLEGACVNVCEQMNSVGSWMKIPIHRNNDNDNKDLTFLLYSTRTDALNRRHIGRLETEDVQMALTGDMSSVIVQASLCWTCSENQIVVLLNSNQ